MPELPEVETIRRTLVPHVVGARIGAVEVRERRLRRPLAPDFEQRVARRRIADVARRGKYLLFDLEGGEYLLAHLGMSGTLEIRAATAPARRHDHVRLILDRPTALVYNDPRRFGLLCAGPLAALAPLAAVGPDPLSEPWDRRRLRDLVRHRRVAIKTLLMDQRHVGGIGNIYANEICFRAGLRPTRRAAGLYGRELDALAAAIPAVLHEAVALGGSSIADFRDGEGRTGYFQLHTAVYDRAGAPCRQCGAPIKALVLGGRSTFYCPRCQR